MQLSNGLLKPPASLATLRLTESSAPPADRAEFDALGPAWDDLHVRCGESPFLSHAFIRLWLKHFGADTALRCLTVGDAQGRLVAALPLLQRRSTWHGLPIDELRAPVNVHSCRFDLLGGGMGAAAALLDQLQALTGWDVVCLPDVPNGGRAAALLETARTRGFATGAWPASQAPYLPLDPGGPQLSAKFRANLRRRRRHLQMLGRVELDCVVGGSDLLPRLHEGLQLEASGWKAAAGTALLQDPATLAFYTELALHSAGDGTLRLWFLRLDGRAIAFHYALEHDGVYLLLKPAYDERLAAYSPGQLLMEDVVQDCTARGLREVDFLGEDMPWKRDWTRRQRAHAWLYLFRGWRGRLLHALKFGLAQRLRSR